MCSELDGGDFGRAMLRMITSAIAIAAMALAVQTKMTWTRQLLTRKWKLRVVQDTVSSR